MTCATASPECRARTGDERAIDAWLRHSLARDYGTTMLEPTPRGLLALIDELVSKPPKPG